jgi:FlaA1/EpsC-like NDP-sugar epimerase
MALHSASAFLDGNQTLRRYRQAVALSAYALLTIVCYAAAVLLRFEFRPPSEMVRVFAITVVLLLAVRMTSSWAFGLVRGRWRYAGTRDVVRLVLGTTFGSAGFYLLTRGGALFPVVPRSIVLLEWILTTYSIAALWVGYRLLLERVRHLRSTRPQQRVLIVGAGEAGSLLVREMLRTPTGYRPLGFLDDDPQTWHSMVHGLTVFGGIDMLPRLVIEYDADEVVIAVPSASPSQLRRIVAVCEATSVRFKVLPGVATVLSGNVRLNHLRDLRIEDLLGREPVQLELPELYNDLRGRSVLITGAAGSIGSELARQVALHEPAILLLLDQAETPLFYLERELREKHPDLQLVFVVCDIVDGNAIARLFHDYAPSRVYHAAAYKHVTMMQVNARAAVRNNILGTYVVAEAAGRNEVEKFVLVSTDKAVKPTSVMGATKRLAEIAIQEMQVRHPATSFAAVRFGNVLGSNGSVIPIFKEQIEAGKPLTVTHPEVTRYFMTIPEAVHLILQASLLPDMHGRIAMLEMGEPVRIVDLAKNLLRLSGNSYTTRDLVFTGLRWGEKLHEDLTAPDEVTTPTIISKVKLVQPSMVSLSRIMALLDEWEEAFAEGRDSAVISSLVSLFPDLHYPTTQQADAERPKIAASF